MIQIRPIRDADIEPLRVILNQVIECGDAFVYEQPFTPDDVRLWLASGCATFVATVDERVAGAYLLRVNQPGRGSHVAKAAYLVSSESRGLGIGRRLGEHSLAEAKRRGFLAIQFNAVVASNTTAVALWKSLGFTIVGAVPQAFRHANGRWVDLYVMHRFLE